MVGFVRLWTPPPRILVALRPLVVKLGGQTLRRVGTFRAAGALGLGGPRRTSRPADGKVHAHTAWAGFVGKEAGPQRSPLSRVPGERRVAPVTEGHLCTSTSSDRRSFRTMGRRQWEGQPGDCDIGGGGPTRGGGWG